MNVNLKVIEYIIYLEFIIVAILVLLAFVLKIYFSIKQKRLRNLSEETENFLLKLLKNPALFSSFPNKSKKISILLPIIRKFDETMNNENWRELKEKIDKEILHGIARKAAFSKRWPCRFLAAESFKLYVENQDQEIIIKLINDKYPLVTLSAGATAIKLLNPKPINALIDRMSTERRLAITMFLVLFENANSKIINIIFDRLNNDSNPYIRASGYKILQKLSITEKFENFQKDLESTNIELKLSALRYIAYSKNDKAVSILTNMLNNQEWEVRSASVQLLSNLSAAGAIDKIAILLRDPTWWVRLNAAFALKNLGSEGMNVLKLQNPVNDKYAYEAAQYVLQYN